MTRKSSQICRLNLSFSKQTKMMFGVDCKWKQIFFVCTSKSLLILFASKNYLILMGKSSSKSFAIQSWCRYFFCSLVNCFRTHGRWVNLAVSFYTISKECLEYVQLWTLHLWESKGMVPEKSLMVTICLILFEFNVIQLLIISYVGFFYDFHIPGIT